MSEVEGAGGTAHLVGDNTQLIPFTVEPEHGEGEVLADGPDHPAGAQDQAPSSCSKNVLYRCLSSSFAGAVSAKGVTALLGLIGRALGPVEHKVGADLKQASPLLIQSTGKGFGCPGIYCVG